MSTVHLTDLKWSIYLYKKEPNGHITHALSKETIIVFSKILIQSIGALLSIFRILNIEYWTKLPQSLTKLLQPSRPNYLK